MKYTKITDLKKHDGKSVTVRGFVKQVRDLKSIQFLIVRDITESVQVTVFKTPENAELNAKIAALTQESSVIVTGKVHVDAFVKLNGVELLAADAVCVNLADNNLPLDLTDFNESNRDLRLDWRFLDLRSKEHQLIFKVQTTAEAAMRDFWRKNDFIEIHSPKLMGNPSESGAELFSLDYFGRTAYLSQSPQFYKQMAIAAGFERVFEVGPVFRADPSSTNRHATEFTGLDAEIAWINSHEDVMKNEEEWIAYFLAAVKKKHGEEIKAVFNREVVVPALPFPRLTMEQAKEVIREKGYEVPASTKGDLDPPAERLLGAWAMEKYGHEFVFVKDYPAAVRPFYHMRHEKNPGLTKSFDLLWNGIEITTGAQREHRYDIVTAQAREKGLHLEPIQSYLNCFRFGCPPHGGFGVGLARILMNLLGYANLREVAFIHRGQDRLFP
ncbi:aspartate--tRNA(Asn) ligase [Clostridia bacterium]|nr:aspartate--tRNA(Asn) ligase [Clostridia bacterium]